MKLKGKGRDHKVRYLRGLGPSLDDGIYNLPSSSSSYSGFAFLKINGFPCSLVPLFEDILRWDTSDGHMTAFMTPSSNILSPPYLLLL